MVRAVPDAGASHRPRNDAFLRSHGRHYGRRNYRRSAVRMDVRQGFPVAQTSCGFRLLYLPDIRRDISYAHRQSYNGGNHDWRMLHVHIRSARNAYRNSVYGFRRDTGGFYGGRSA